MLSQASLHSVADDLSVVYVRQPNYKLICNLSFSRPKIQRIIQIWESRSIFDVPFILALRQSLISGKVIKPEETKVPRTAIEPPSVQGVYL